MTNIQTIKSTEFTQEATVVSLDFIPSIEDQNNIFNNDDSIVLEF